MAEAKDRVARKGIEIMIAAPEEMVATEQMATEVRMATAAVEMATMAKEEPVPVMLVKFASRLWSPLWKRHL